MPRKEVFYSHQHTHADDTILFVNFANDDSIENQLIHRFLD